MWEFFGKSNRVVKPSGSLDIPQPGRSDLAASSIDGSASLQFTALAGMDVVRTASVPGDPAPGTLSAPMKRRVSLALRQAVNFKDVTLTTSSARPLAQDGGGFGVEAGGKVHGGPMRDIAVQKNKMVIIMVGLPARGKTFLCNKLMSYLNWLGHTTGHFNVGFYRRAQKTEQLEQDANFFDQANPAGMEARERALHAALDDMLGWLRRDEGQVAILDATNSTHARRVQLRERLHGRCQYLFIESICNDEETLERNYRNKLLYSPDYTGVDEDDAIADFKARIRKYEEVYEPIDDRSYHYIKLIDMVTGR